MKMKTYFAPAIALVATTLLMGCAQWFEGDLTGPVTQDSSEPVVVVDLDHDDDNALDESDNCPLVSNADQADGDADLSGDACDNCPCEPNSMINGVQGPSPCDQPAIVFDRVEQISTPAHTVQVYVRVYHTYYTDSFRWIAPGSTCGGSITTVSGYRRLRPCWDTGYTATYLEAGSYSITFRVGNNLEQTFNVNVE